MIDTWQEWSVIVIPIPSSLVMVSSLNRVNYKNNLNTEDSQYRTEFYAY